MMRLALRSVPTKAIQLHKCPALLGSLPTKWPTNKTRIKRVRTSINEGTKTTPEVVAPRMAEYDINCLNSVTLTGIVTEPPIERITRKDGYLVELTLAIPRVARDMSRVYFDTCRVAFFDFSAQQAIQYCTQGAKIVVQGRLRSYRTYISITVNQFALVNETTWPFGDDVYIEPGRQIGGPSIVRPYLMKTVVAVHEEYEKGKELEEIAKERNYQLATVLSYLGEAAFYGLTVDFEYLARNCLLGPANSQYMETDVVHAAILAVSEKQRTKNLEDVAVKDAHDLLRAHKGGKPFKIQEEVINSVTYAQLTVVLAMMKRGLTSRDWNAFKVAPSRTPLIQNEDDDMPPF